MTAAKLICIEAPMRETGSINTSIAAATARLRIDIARLPANTAKATNPAMTKLRTIGTCEPVSTM